MRLDTSGAEQTQLKRPPLGLALGGGVARGWAHIGALKALIEADIRPDIIAGTSIGALVGGVYLAGKLEVLENWALALNRRRMMSYMDIRWGGSGLMRGDRLARVLNHYLGDTQIEDLDRKYTAVACDLRTGYEVWLQKGALVDAVRASYALPGAFDPVRIDGRYMIDGALVNPVPVSACRALGAHMVIESINKLRPDRLLLKSMMGTTAEGKSPKLGSVMMSTLNIVMDRISRSRLAGDPPDVFVAPRIGHIGMMEFTKADELIERGYRAMQREIPLIQSVIEVLSQIPSGNNT